ncbi:MAG: hypothetical protein ACREFV_09425 [Acetobacteraceae bacterium]
MDGANERFKANPTQWIADHLIVYNVGRGGANPFGQGPGAVGTELSVHDFDLRKIGAIQTEGGTVAKEYELRELTEGIDIGVLRKPTIATHTIRAYFLPWGTKSTYCGRLGVAAKYFFTPTLNGCTFAHSGAGPNPSVAHSNFVDQLSTIADQGAMNADLAQKFGGLAPPNTLVRATYKRAPIGEEDYRATVIGIRTGNTWNFYYQNYKYESLGQNTQRHTGLGMQGLSVAI